MMTWDSGVNSPFPLTGPFARRSEQIAPSAHRRAFPGSHGIDLTSIDPLNATNELRAASGARNFALQGMV